MRGFFTGFFKTGRARGVMSGQDKNTLHDSAMGWGILMAVMFCVFLLFWYFYEYEVKNAFRWYRWTEMKAVSLFVDEDYTVEWDGYKTNHRDFMNAVPNIKRTDLDSETVALLSIVAMKPYKIPFMVIMGLMAAWCFAYGPGTQFRRKLDLNGIIGTQSKIFPVISPFVKFNPSTVPPRPPGAPVPAELPPFAEALGPEEWIAYNQVPVPDGKVDEQAAFVAFSRQLGPRWQGPLKIADHKKILLAAFCLKAARKRKDADEMLGRIANCWDAEKGLQISRDKTLLKDSLAVLRNRDLAGKVLAKCNQHGFETTALLKALNTAREEGGVLAPAQFVWLRAHDRTLWYPLNNLGRQSFHMEALGAMAHYKAERLTQRPIPKPKVQNAVKSVSDYMRSPRARPIPQLTYKGTRKKGVKQPAKK